MFGIDFVRDLGLILLPNFMLLQVELSLGSGRLMIEGNGAQLNCSSGEYGSGCIGRAGVLLQASGRKIMVVAKMNPITEELERGSDGLCVKVYSL